MKLPAVIELPLPTDFHSWLRVRTPYSADFVTAIKWLPRWARQFDPDQKCWLVDVSYLTEVKRLCKEFYGDVEVTTGPKPKPKPPKGTRYLGGDVDCDHRWANPWLAAVVERCGRCEMWKVPPLRVAIQKGAEADAGS